MRCEVEDESSLAHCRACGNDDEVGLLEPARHGIEGRKPRGETRDPPLCLCEFAHTIHGIKDHILDGDKRTCRLSARNRKDLALGIIELLGDVLARLIGRPCNLRARVNKGAQNCLFLYDLGVVCEVCRARHAVRQICEERDAADLLDEILFFQQFRHGDDVDGLPIFDQFLHRLEHGAVCLSVKLIRAQQLDCLCDRCGFEHHRAEDGQLRLNALRGNASFRHEILLSPSTFHPQRARQTPPPPSSGDGSSAQGAPRGCPSCSPTG